MVLLFGKSKENFMNNLNYIPTGLQFRQTFEMLKLNTPPPNGVLPPSGSIFVWVEVPIIGTGEAKKIKYRDETGVDRDFVDNISQEQIDIISKIIEILLPSLDNSVTISVSPDFILFIS